MKRHCRVFSLIATLIAPLFLCSCQSSESYSTHIFSNDNIPSGLHESLCSAYAETLRELRLGQMPPAILPFEESSNATDLNASNSDRVNARRGVDNNAPSNSIPDTFAPAKPAHSIFQVAHGQGDILAEVYVQFGKGIADKQRIDADLGFQFTLEPNAREMGVVFATFTRGEVSYLLRASYAKSDTGWQLYTLEYGDYAYSDLNAQALYEKAIAFRDAGQTIPAAVYSYLAGEALSPCGIFYPNHDEIAQAMPQLLSAVHAKYTFPYTVYLEDTSDKSFDPEQAETATLFGFAPVVSESDGVCVELRYFSEIDFRSLYESELDEEAYAQFLALLGEEVKERAELALQQHKLDSIQKELDAEAANLLYWMQSQRFDQLVDAFPHIYMTAYNRIAVVSDALAENDEKTKFVYFQHTTEIDAAKAVASVEKELAS